MAGTALTTSVYYPESDGKPMGETDMHVAAIVRHRELLMHYFAGRDVYVSRNLLLYYEQGNPKRFVVPDTFVVKGVPQHERRTFKIWDEKAVPNTIIEVTSRKTRKMDVTEKPELYARLGVKEYFIFDPELEYLNPPFQGHRLVGGKFERIQADADNGLVSEELGLRMKLEEGLIQFYRLDNGERLMTAEERVAIAEAEVARLRAELAKKSHST